VEREKNYIFFQLASMLIEIMLINLPSQLSRFNKIFIYARYILYYGYPFINITLNKIQYL
jgi:hypothetical protein